MITLLLTIEILAAGLLIPSIIQLEIVEYRFERRYNRRFYE